MGQIYFEQPTAVRRRRARGMMVVAVCAFVILIGRLAQLQLVQGEVLMNAATRNYVRTVDLPAERGSILDRKGRVLAVHKPSFDLKVTPAFVSDLDVLIDELKAVVELDELDWIRLKERILAPRGMWRYRALLIARDIGRDRVARAEALRARVDGLSVEVRYQRHYPEGELGAHLLGYLGKPTAAELRDQEGNKYKADSMLGRSGLERRYEDLLSGEPGFRKYAVDARGAKASDGWARDALAWMTREQLPERGRDVVLNIDVEIQRILDRALRRYQSGAALVLNVSDGRILGMVSKPGYDPNQWSGRLTAKAKKLIDENPHNPMLDKTVKAYFPGSVYKVVTALAGLEEGLITAEQLVESPGVYEFGNRKFHCHKRGGHGWINLSTALAASADVYFYKLGERLGIDTMAQYARRFGFGQKPGLGLNGESPGLVPTKEHHEKKTRGGFQHGFALSTAVGQGDVRLSPLHVGMAYVALANGGTVFVPRVVDRAQDAQGRVLHREAPREMGRIASNPEYIDAIHAGLVRAVHDDRVGTALLGRPETGRVAGKTGTAQVRQIVRGHLRQSVKRFKDRDHAWFAAYAPADSPQVVVVVFLDHGGSGGKHAAPVAQEIIRRLDRGPLKLFTEDPQAILDSRSEP